MLSLTPEDRQRLIASGLMKPPSKAHNYTDIKPGVEYRRANRLCHRCGDPARVLEDGRAAVTCVKCAKLARQANKEWRMRQPV